MKARFTLGGVPGNAGGGRRRLYQLARVEAQHSETWHYAKLTAKDA